jgi:hypothetical protein
MSVKFLSIGFGSYLLAMASPAIAQAATKDEIAEFALGFVGIVTPILFGSLSCSSLVSAYALIQLVFRSDRSLANYLVPSSASIFHLVAALVFGQLFGWTDPLVVLAVASFSFTVAFALTGFSAWLRSRNESKQEELMQGAG